MQGYHLSFKDMGKGYENPNLVLHDPDGAQHPDGSHRQGKVGSSPDGRGQTLAICQGKNSLTY